MVWSRCRPGGGQHGSEGDVLVAGMTAGADSIDGLDVLRDGAMGRLFTEIKARLRSGRYCGLTFGMPCDNPLAAIARPDSETRSPPTATLRQ